MKFWQDCEPITGSQIRAARAMLNWPATELAKRCGVARTTILGLERSGGVPASRAETIRKLRVTFELAGIEFIGSEGDGPGVRLWKMEERTSVYHDRNQRVV
ncbi:helix-turn-helix domain-containing protein [Alsobacter sp. SYSU BS001988]